jgi:hypothetical protein
MKVDEFLQHRDPGDETEHVEDFQHVTSLTPSGLEVLYSWAPKRLYRVRAAALRPEAEGGYPTDWRDVPSVTSVLGILDKSGALSWWSQGIATGAIIDFFNEGVLVEGQTGDAKGKLAVPELAEENESWPTATAENVVPLLTKYRKSINHVTNKAADRGTNVHGALESWAIDQDYRANPDLYEEHEQGYIVGLNKFLDDLGEHGRGEVFDVEAEVMVGSLENGFAGRYDLRLIIPSSREMVVKTYPKRADKRETVDAGSYLLDLKTSKDCYPSHSLQLAAYEQASIECGYGSTHYRAVIRVTADGKYEFRRANAEFDDFKAVLTAYTAMQRKAWFS